MELSAPGRATERAVSVHHAYTAAEIVRLLEAAGFEVGELLGDPVARTASKSGIAACGAGAGPLIRLS